MSLTIPHVVWTYNLTVFDELPEEDCMSLQQLADVVKIAAYHSKVAHKDNGNVDVVERSTVILTSCDMRVRL